MCRDNATPTHPDTEGQHFIRKTLRRAGKQDLVAGGMVVVCPRCHIAFVVKDREVEVAVPA